ncbi:hypothetical protein [Microbacterium murale]|uniref:Uncharacterized protein n=1 Tax=Microbacterium murale TaxID=1081040 RepID=A0ABQ1S590_9MICO|nr:hypothetical protein [Microbacterium murale]GGD90907.1 hypothetical protein GCM10007269_36880 [Microbacterium murale]
MSEVNFHRYREYVRARVEANNAMIALLAGSRLAAHSLQLHEGSPHQLPGLFPAVKDIDRFNLLPGRASELLLDADAHLAAVAIPYALAVYEAFVKDAIALVAEDGFAVSAARGALNAGRMHQTLYEAVETEQPNDTIAMFHLLRTIRNAQIHHAGAATSELLEVVSSLSIEQRQRWESLVMGPLDDMLVDDRLSLTIGHLIAAFAVTKEGARRINQLLVIKLSRRTWAEMAVRDYAETANHPINSRQWKKGLLGFVRFNYLGGIALSDGEMRDASVSTGLWTSPSW